MLDIEKSKLYQCTSNTFWLYCVVNIIMIEYKDIQHFYLMSITTGHQIYFELSKYFTAENL